MNNLSEREYAYWLADKIPAYGDYAKEAALVLQRQANTIATLRQALKNHAEEAAKMVNAEPVAWMTEDGRVATDETKKTAMPRVARDSFNIPLFRRPQA